MFILWKKLNVIDLIVTILFIIIVSLWIVFILHRERSREETLNYYNELKFEAIYSGMEIGSLLVYEKEEIKDEFIKES